METIKNSIGLKLTVLWIGILFAMVILPTPFKSIAIGIFAILTIVLAIQRKAYFNLPFFLWNAALFCLLVFTFLYTENTEYGIRKLSTMASLIVFPALFSFIRKEDDHGIFKYHNQYLWVYVVSVFAFNVVAFLWFYITNYSFAGMIEHFATVVRVDMGKWRIHPIYLSMHCAVALLFSMYLLKATRSKRLIMLLLSIDMVLILFLLLYAKKGPLLALLVVFTLFVAFQRKQGLVKPYLVAMVVVVGLTVAIPKTRNKFVELLKIENLDKGSLTSTNIRYTIYACAKELIADAAFLGYGIGDYNDVLQKSYKEKDKPILVAGEYNAHNQFFSLMLMGGVLAVVFFGLMLAVNFVFAIRYDNQLLILLLIFYSLVMLTENILEREQGVIYFSLFLSYFGLRNRYLEAHADSTNS
ncbi:O-antigen ligase family protein [Dokdonia sinensis]|uniref:O-antigen ligase family protein n=1 Tax=Dokdonia sinensis TaxID=2479847 RepID=A0A3M0GKY5_9FLAO|nr:O-antigen ligase family protein [Dokdonia sinensis]RMB57956.1 O-antigen ligase family protein [Dokdonia sinensis]